jgi:transcriptional regulator with XRE-family HTH domain
MEWDPAHIRALRAALRLPQEKFAQRLGAAPKTVRNWEQGRHPPSLALQRALDQAWASASPDQEERFRACLARDDEVREIRPASRTPGQLDRDSTNAARQDSRAFAHIMGKDIAALVSRRDLLAGLGIGVLGGTVLGAVERALGSVIPTHEMLLELEQALDGFHSAVRAITPARLIDDVTMQVAVLDALRRCAADGELRRSFTVLQSRYAESLSWMHEEAGDITGAVYWTDRAAHWAQAANWVPMVAYAFVRRSMMAITFAADGRRAVENAQYVLHIPGAPAYIKGLAAKQMSFGYALVGSADDSARALDLTTRLLGQRPQEDERPILGQRSVVSDDLLAIFQATCDVYLGRGESVIRILEPRLRNIGKGSWRTSTITRAKLAQAYANAGLPGKACSLTLEALDAADAIGSLSAMNELRRALPRLADWSHRSDVKEVQHRLLAS